MAYLYRKGRYAAFKGCFWRNIRRGDGVCFGHVQAYAVLAAFRDSVEVKWLEWNGKVKEMQIKEKEKELAYYKKKVVETEKEINELKML